MNIIISLLFSSDCSKVPAFLNVVDIAGLVKGAAEGQGLGNAFLSHISACDSIFHLAREYSVTYFAFLMVLEFKKISSGEKLKFLFNFLFFTLFRIFKNILSKNIFSKCYHCIAETLGPGTQ